MPAPSARPPCLLSVQNELEWEIQGIVVSADTPEHLLTPDYPGSPALPRLQSREATSWLGEDRRLSCIGG